MPVRFRDGPSESPSRTALLLVNLGTPEAPTPSAIRRYLGEFLHDYRVVDLSRWLWCPLLHGAILPLRAGKLARSYADIWTEQGSPLLAHSRDLATTVQSQLPEFDVRLAMRYGQPAIAAVLRELHAAGMARLLVLPLYPQYSASTVASVHDAVMAELSHWRRLPELRLINDYHVDDDWLDALQASVLEHWDLHGRGELLLMSFHGLPERYVRAGDPYPGQCQASAHALAMRLGLRDDQWRLSYQSRFGREPWLTPATDVTLTTLAAAGVRKVDVICPGFAVDCLETLAEIAMENAARFQSLGGELRYIPALNGTSRHAVALAVLARRHLQAWPP